MLPGLPYLSPVGCLTVCKTGFKTNFILHIICPWILINCCIINKLQKSNSVITIIRVSPRSFSGVLTRTTRFSPLHFILKIISTVHHAKQTWLK